MSDLEPTIKHVIATNGIYSNTSLDTVYIDINWPEFDQRYVNKSDINIRDNDPYILTADWAGNVSKIDTLKMKNEIKAEILFDLHHSLDLHDNQSDHISDAWQDVKDAITAYIIAKKLAT